MPHLNIREREQHAEFGLSDRQLCTPYMGGEGGRELYISLATSQTSDISDIVLYGGPLIQNMFSQCYINNGQTTYYFYEDEI